MAKEANGEGGGEAPKLTLEIDGEEKTFGADDVINLVKQQASATQSSQKAAPIIRAAERYGVDPEVLLQQAEGAFGLVSQLMDQGVINEKGELVQKGSASGDEGEDDPLATLFGGAKDKGKLEKDGQNSGGIDQTQFLSTVQRVVEKALNPLQEKIKSLEQDQTSLVRSDIERKLRSKYEGLTSEDVDNILRQATRDGRKSLLDHAEQYVNGMKSREQQLREKHAKEFGIDLKEWEQRNKEREQHPDGISAVLKGRKVSFRGGKDTVHPRQALHEFMQRSQRE